MRELARNFCSAVEHQGDLRLGVLDEAGKVTFVSELHSPMLDVFGQPPIGAEDDLSDAAHGLLGGRLRLGKPAVNLRGLLHQARLARQQVANDFLADAIGLLDVGEMRRLGHHDQLSPRNSLRDLP